MITDLNKKVKKITVDGVTMELKPKVLGGDYNLESVLLEDGTQKMVATFVGTEGQEIEVELPEEFQSEGSYGIVTFIYKNTILMSTTSADVGLWVYNIDTDKFTKLRNEAQWNSFYEVSDGVLLSSKSSNTGLLHFDGINLTQIEGSSSYYNINIGHTLKNGDYLFSSQNLQNVGLCYYNNETKTLTHIGSDTVNNFYELENGDTLCSYSSSASIGLWLFDFNLKIATELDSMIARLTWTPLSDGNLVGTSSISGAAGGLLVYYKETKTTTRFLTANYADQTEFTVVKPLLNGDFIVSRSNSNTQGVYLYKANDMTFNKIFEEGYNFNSCTVLESGNAIISSSSSNVKGIYFYNNTNNTISQIYQDGYGYSNRHVVSSDLLLLSNSSSYYGTGLFLYDDSTNTITPLLTDEYNMYGLNTKNGALIEQYNGSKIWFFNKTSKELNVLLEVSTYANIFDNLIKPNENIILFNTNSVYSAPLFLYNESEHSIERLLTSSGSQLDRYFIKDNLVNLWSSKKSSQPKTFEYNIDTNTIKLVKYYIGKI